MILDRFDLQNKVAIVTGASSGLGAECAHALAEAGADVAVAARRSEQLQVTKQCVERVGRRALAVRTDVTDPDACQALVDETVASLGRVDILINNAGIGGAAPALREDPDAFRRIIDVNLAASYWMARAAAKRMAPGGSIVNISSVLAMTTAGLPQAAYSASKAGVLGLTRDLAQQWSPRIGIRVNAICPGYFLSEMTEVLDDAYLGHIAERRTLLGRLGDPTELAAAVVFLASDAASYLTGTTMIVDGGLTIT